MSTKQTKGMGPMLRYFASPATVGGGGCHAVKWTLWSIIYKADPARESEPILGCCWAIVRDVGPTQSNIG